MMRIAPEHHDLCAILDYWTDDRCVCASVDLWTEGADALEVALVEAANDLRMASEIFREHPQTAAKLMSGVADRAQVYARSVDVARRTGQRVCANREHSDADCEQE